MKTFDARKQTWVDPEAEEALQRRHESNASGQRVAVVRTLAVLVTCGVAFGIWALGWKDEPEPVADATSTQEPVSGASSDVDGPDPSGSFDSDSSDSSDGASPSDEISASPTPPAGFQVLTDDQGFRIAVPSGSERSTQPAQFGLPAVVNYVSSDGLIRVQHFQVSEDSPVDSMTAATQQVSSLDGFHEIGHRSLMDDQGLPAAELEYTADKVNGEADDGETRHVLDYRFKSADGSLHALIVYGRSDDGPEDEEQALDAAKAWFCPADTTCEPPADGGASTG